MTIKPLPNKRNRKPRFSEDKERRPLLTKAELSDACLHCAATIVVAVELGCEFEDCRLTDDGRKWPTFLSDVDIKYPTSWADRGAEVFPAIASIHEAGCQAVAKQHGRGPNRINEYTAIATSNLLDEPRIWKAIEAFISIHQEQLRGGRLLRRSWD